MSDRWSRVVFLTGGALVTVAAVITPYAATGITLHVVGTASSLEGSRSLIQPLSEPQMSNRATKRDRVALLNDSSSYTNFDSSSLRLALSRLQTQDGVSGLLNDAQLTGIANRLRLSPQQAQYWPAVAAALRDVGRRYFQNRSRARTIPLNSNEVKLLIEAATPLIARLSEEQKREARQLMRIIGLQSLASEI